MKPRYSLVINHTPWRPERREALQEMLVGLELSTKDRASEDPRALELAVAALLRDWPDATPAALKIHDTDYRGRDWQDDAKVAWELAQWRWAAERAECTHHVFMTDDLHIAPRFWDVLDAMVTACPDKPIGLLSNHPRAVELAADGYGWYRTNSWIVGPAYVLPRSFLLGFLDWFEALPKGSHKTPGTQAYRNDDSSINEFVTRSGLWSAHPLPTIIEHRGDLESTVGHGDEHSRERISWREFRAPVKSAQGVIGWASEPHTVDIEAMTRAGFWNVKGGVEAAPLLSVGG